MQIKPAKNKGKIKLAPEEEKILALPADRESVCRQNERQ
jgi:hypothetical protein